MLSRNIALLVHRYRLVNFSRVGRRSSLLCPAKNCTSKFFSMMRNPLAVTTRRVLLTIVLLVVSIGMFAQISGPEICMIGIDNTYTCYGTSSQNWSVSNSGTIVSTSLSGPVSVVVIRWNAAGAGVVSLNPGGTVYTKNVTVLDSPLPPEADHRSRCGPGIVTFSTYPGQGGTSVKWFADATGGNLWRKETRTALPLRAQKYSMQQLIMLAQTFTVRPERRVLLL